MMKETERIHLIKIHYFAKLNTLIFDIRVIKSFYIKVQ